MDSFAPLETMAGTSRSAASLPSLSALFVALLDTDDHPVGIALAQIAFEMPHLVDRVFTLFRRIARHTRVEHADLAELIAAVGPDDLCLQPFHDRVFSTGVLGALPGKLCIQRRTAEFPDLVHVVGVPCVLQFDKVRPAPCRGTGRCRSQLAG